MSILLVIMIQLFCHFLPISASVLNNNILIDLYLWLLTINGTSFHDYLFTVFIRVNQDLCVIRFYNVFSCTTCHLACSMQCQHFANFTYLNVFIRIPCWHWLFERLFNTMFVLSICNVITSSNVHSIPLLWTQNIFFFVLGNMNDETLLHRVIECCCGTGVIYNVFKFNIY